jgi:DNA-binding PadR family transcriptional regulator
MDDKKRILKQLKMGTTEILILLVLKQRDCYGYEITREVSSRSTGYFELKQGFLYPTLRRMESAKLIQGYWKHSATRGPNRRYYRLTARGITRLKISVEAWSEFSGSFNHMLSDSAE